MLAVGSSANFSKVKAQMGNQQVAPEANSGPTAESQSFEGSPGQAN
jgi:hypothetical protein